MNRCTVCLYPDSRPDSHFVDGVCSGCMSYGQRQNINWDDRLEQLKQWLKKARDHGGPYDCVVPVSGGKDSTYQVIKLQELGARILCVNSATDYQTPLGRKNLDNLKRFADMIEVTPNIEARKKLVRIGLRMIGDLSYPEHLAIWSIPTRIAHQMNIPLVVWGEQPQREYATPEGVAPSEVLDADWVAQFGGMLGLRLDDLIGVDGLTSQDLQIYRFPRETSAIGIWLGDYVNWDGWKNYFIAQHYGFESSPNLVETSSANYENLDNYVTVLRDYLRFLKYGYSRSTDILCNQIRRGRITREEGLALMKRREPFPKTSLGKPIEEVLAYFDISNEGFKAECRKWTNVEVHQSLRNESR